MTSRAHIVAGMLASVAVAISNPASVFGQSRPDGSNVPDRVGSLAHDRVAGSLELLRHVAVDGRPDPVFRGIDGASTVRVDIRGDCRGTSSIRTETLPWHRLSRMRKRSCVRRVEPSGMPGALRALEVTTETAAVAASHVRPVNQVDGEGVTIAMLDSPVDLLHPAFFRPDGGRYRWIDVNDDGRFSPGIDAVDLNENGRADHNETLRAFPAKNADAGSPSEDFRTRASWLFADSNGNGERDAGPSDGFNSYDPAFAEPTFVAEDVDRDGRLEPAEALYRLDSSKIERVVERDETFVRGENLAEAARAGFPERASHGTAVAGILVGGQLGFHRRVGIAPRADLIVLAKKRELHDGGMGQLRAIQRARRLDADVFLSEWTNPFTRPLDGSTNVEQAMAEAREAGAIQVVPVGNLDDSEKHVETNIQPGSRTTTPFDVPEQLRVDGNRVDIRTIFGTLQWRSADELKLFLKPPDGPRKLLGAEGEKTDFPGLDVRMSLDRTPRGTMVATFYITGRAPDDSTKPLPAGRWNFSFVDANSKTKLYGRISDAHSGWNRGVGWTNPSAGAKTVAYPATAEAAVGVAAHVGRRPTGDPELEVGDLRPFSGRGPSLDGRRVVDIAAPDNPFVPAAVTGRAPPFDRTGGWYRQFGGTSGAAPHVAGSFALLRELAPGADPNALEQRLFDAADTSRIDAAPDSLPNRRWGGGRLRLYPALHGTSAPESSPPEARLEVARTDRDTLRFDASESSDPDGDPLAFRFDFDYDGDWDTDWRSNGRADRNISALDTSAASTSGIFGRVEVRDEHGLRGGALSVLPASKSNDVGDDLAGGGSRDAGGGISSGGGGGLTPFQCSQLPPAKYPPLSGLLVVTSLVVWRRRDRHP